MRKMHRIISSCACAKYHPGLCYPFIHFVISKDSVNGQWRPWSDCADAQADLGLRCPHMPEYTFLHGAAIMKLPRKGDSHAAQPSRGTERRKKKMTKHNGTGCSTSLVKCHSIIQLISKTAVEQNRRLNGGLKPEQKKIILVQLQTAIVTRQPSDTDRSRSCHWSWDAAYRRAIKEGSYQP